MRGIRQLFTAQKRGRSYFSFTEVCSKSHFLRFFVFRPISVLPVLSKVFEKLVAIQMTNYADHAHLLHDRISAFRKGHSTTTALLIVRDDISLCHEKERGHTYGVSRFLEGF